MGGGSYKCVGGWPKNRWDVRLMGGGRLTLNIGGRLAPKTGGRLEVGPQNRWEMGGWPTKQVGDGKLAHKTGKRSTQTTHAHTPHTPGTCVH